jgi:hypothetical protein
VRLLAITPPTEREIQACGLAFRKYAKYSHGCNAVFHGHERTCRAEETVSKWYIR